MATASFALLAALVAAGVLTGLDQHAVDSWMPGLDHGPGSRGTGLVGSESLSEVLVPRWLTPRHGSAAASLFTYVVVLAASGLPSLLVVAGSLWVLWRRGARALAACLAASFLLTGLVEVVTKATLRRDALTAWVPPGSEPRNLPFDHSFPSGHALRSLLMAACIALALPAARRLRVLLAAWATVVPVLLVTGAWHTPTDVLGGVLLGVLALAVSLAAAPWVRARGPGWLRGTAAA